MILPEEICWIPFQQWSCTLGLCPNKEMVQSKFLEDTWRQLTQAASCSMVLDWNRSLTHIYIYTYIYTYTVQFMRTVLWNLNLMHVGHVGWCTSYQLCQGNFLPRLNKDEYAAMWIVIPFDCVWFCLLKCPLPCAAVVSSMWQPKNWHYRSMQVWAPSKCVRCANAETEIKCLYLMFCRTQPRPI